MKGQINEQSIQVVNKNSKINPLNMKKTNEEIDYFIAGPGKRSVMIW